MKTNKIKLICAHCGKIRTYTTNYYNTNFYAVPCKFCKKEGELKELN